MIPLLHRMPNLEKLGLYLVVYLNHLNIDGDELEKNIINHMTRLNKFTFNIRSIIVLNNQVSLPSNEYIQYTFRNFKDNQIISCVDYFPEANEHHRHFYSYPYTLTYYDNITNKFPGGLFKCVREVSLFDEHPFEHEFFLQIAQSFPFMKKLILNNWKPQTNKLYTESMNGNEQWSIIEYPHLIDLDLVRTHENYVEQFLLDTRMCLPGCVGLFINYKTLRRVTHNFTRDATRINCSKIDWLSLCNKPEFSHHFEDYFPYATIV
jgi:hypothetical protein